MSSTLEKAEGNNGFIGKGWSGFKNLTGIGDGSDKVREKQILEQKLMDQFNTNPQRRAEIFKQLTGLDYTPQNIAKFLKGQVKLQSEVCLDKYIEGQDMAVDIISDVAAGVTAAGIYAGCIIAAPVSGGTSLAGLAVAAGTGAVVKSSLKQADAESGGREYKIADWAKDSATGAFAGALGPVSMGAGGAASNAVIKTGTSMVAKGVGKKVVSEGSVKAAASAAEYMVDGAVGGALDNGFRTSVNGGGVSETLEATAEGAVAGLVFGGVVHTGSKLVSKGTKSINKTFNSFSNAAKIQDVNVNEETVLLKIKQLFKEDSTYDRQAVKSLSEAVNPVNAPFLNAALDVLKINKNANWGDVLTAMKYITPENQSFALSIFKNKNVTPLNWSSVIKNSDEVTIPEFQKLLKNKSFCKSYVGDLEYVNKNNIDLYKKYYNDKRFSHRNDLLTLISDVNSYNKNFIAEVLETYSESNSSKVVYYSRIFKTIDSKLKKEMFCKISSDNLSKIDKFNGPAIANTISLVNEKNKAFLLECINSKKFSIHEINNMFKVYNIDTSLRADVLKTDSMLKLVNSLNDDSRKFLAANGIDLNQLEKYLKGEHQIISTTKEGVKQMFKNVVANNNEDIILNANFSMNKGSYAKKIIDDICAGLPEFKSIANSSKGIETLQVLQDFMKTSEYKMLSDSEKTIGKLSILLSSLKEEQDVILNRYSLDMNMKSRIINIIRNKEMISDCLSGKISEKNVVANFRNYSDYMVAEHIIKSNLDGSVNITPEYSKKISGMFNEFYGSQKFLFTSRILNNGKDFPTVNFEGKNLKVLNLSDLAQSEELAKYGFVKGTTPENITFNVHMTNNSYGTTEVQDIETMIRLSKDEMRDFAPSSTLIKGNNNFTFMGYRYGVILKNNNMNIGTFGFDSVTGTKKGKETFSRLIFGTESSKKYKAIFINSLEENGLKITPQEYIQLTKQLQPLEYLSHIHDIKIGDKIIKAEHLKSAIARCQDSAVESEITSFNPTIEALYAQVKSLQECPKEFVELAEKYNLPIVLQNSK